jgi:hypothetical protein
MAGRICKNTGCQAKQEKPEQEKDYPAIKYLPQVLAPGADQEGCAKQGGQHQTRNLYNPLIVMETAAICDGKWPQWADCSREDNQYRGEKDYRGEPKHHEIAACV